METITLIAAAVACGLGAVACVLAVLARRESYEAAAAAADVKVVQRKVAEATQKLGGKFEQLEERVEAVETETKAATEYVAQLSRLQQLVLEHVHSLVLEHIRLRRRVDAVASTEPDPSAPAPARARATFQKPTPQAPAAEQAERAEGGE